MTSCEVGIGIDDAFVISGAFDATDAELSIPDRMAKAIQRVPWPSAMPRELVSSFLLSRRLVKQGFDSF